MFAVSLLAAGLASGGTYLALQLSGRLDPQFTAGPAAIVTTSTDPTPAPPSPQSVRIDESSAITAAAEKISPAIVTISTSTGKGSGIIYQSSGWILTNRHVVSGARTLTVALKDGRSFPGRVYGTDTLTDLAIVKIDATTLPVAAIGDSKGLKPGQLAIAIGSPLGEFTNSITTGVVSALNRSVDVNDEETGQSRRLRNLIQTDAAINPGNSGGALVDASGQVIGVNTAVAGNGAQGIGFAIPINIAKPIMQQAVNGETLARPYIGISYREVTPSLMEEKKLPIDYGVWLGRDQGDPQEPIVSGSPADRAGLKENDIITSVNGQRIDATDTLDEVLTAFKPGEELVLTVLRDGKTLDLTLTLGTRPATQS
ncbi:MAG: trypsin-like peptidase domain-containing protein [Chloroflexi bacterium]|nr:trypsin-like peptidase domain-containing protein [Chloroflexota bacterium]